MDIRKINTYKNEFDAIETVASTKETVPSTSSGTDLTSSGTGVLSVASLSKPPSKPLFFHKINE